MPLDADVKKQIMTEYATTEGDTGSPEVQIAMLTQRIKDLTEHSRAAQARPPQPSWSAPAGRPPPAPAALPRGDRHRALPLADQAPRPAPMSFVTKGGHRVLRRPPFVVGAGADAVVPHQGQPARRRNPRTTTMCAGT